MAKRTPKTPVATPNWFESLEAFAVDLKARERSQNTIDSYLSDLKGFKAWYEGQICALTFVEQVTGVELREWKKDLLAAKAAPSSVNRKMSALDSFLQFAARKGTIPTAPMKPILARMEPPGPRWLDRKERLQLERTIERAPIRDGAIVLIGLHTGLRVAELAALTWADVTVSDRKGTVTVRQGKGSKLRMVNLNLEAREAFHKIGYLNKRGTADRVFMGKRGPLTPRGIRVVVEGLAAAARLPDLSCHVLRHTFCHDLAAKGVPIEQIAALAGHSSLETTRRYLSPSRGELQDAVERVSRQA